MNDFGNYRSQIERLLDLAEEQLTEGQRDRLRVAIERRHEDWLRIAGDTPVHNLAERLIGQLAEADRDLAGEQVRDLEALISERLPASP